MRSAKPAERPFAPRAYGRLERVTPRVYLFRNVVNSVVVLGDDAAAVIDTQVNAPMARRLLERVKDLSDKPLRWAINTHYHWDHTAGNDIFQAAGATLVSSALTREFMQTRAARQQAFLASRGFDPGPEPCLAHDSITGEREIDLGNQRLVLKSLGAAETDDALAIHLPQEGCVAAGDTVMTGSFPMFGQPVMDEGLMGTAGWLDTLAAIECLGADHVLPGHGPVAREAELSLLKRLERYFSGRGWRSRGSRHAAVGVAHRPGSSTARVDHRHPGGLGHTSLCHPAGVPRPGSGKGRGGRLAAIASLQPSPRPTPPACPPHAMGWQALRRSRPWLRNLPKVATPAAPLLRLAAPPNACRMKPRPGSALPII